MRYLKDLEVGHVQKSAIQYRYYGDVDVSNSMLNFHKDADAGLGKMSHF
jgi:hypothetical protein